MNAPDPTVVEVVDDGLRQRLAGLSVAVRTAVAARRRDDPDPDDPYRGLYVGDDEADRLAAEDGERVLRSRFAGPGSGRDVAGSSRLGALAVSFALDELDLDLLVLALAPELEPRFEKLYGYLHDDLTRRRPSVGLALELCGLGFGSLTGRSRFAADSPLVRNGLLVVEEPTRPLPTRPLRVPDRVVAHLLGDDAIEPTLRDALLPAVVLDLPEASPIAAALSARAWPVHLQDEPGGIGSAVAASALASVGRAALVVSLDRLLDSADPVTAVRAALREARLRDAGLVGVVPDEPDADAIAALGLLARVDWPVVLVGRHPWDPAWSSRPVLSERVVPDGDRSDDVWRACVPEIAPDELHAATRQFRLRPEHVARAATLARERARANERSVTADDVAHGARAQNSSALERLAVRVTPAARWDDLVLPVEVRSQLLELADRYRDRGLVHGDWGMGGKANRRVGVVALFAGSSGVGKTLAAEALAASLSLDLYRVNLATVVDKYIGETEKNLERIFVAAEGVNGVILFDEADALFGKRSEVSDARDRYANVEVAYLLQRLETFGGVAVLATNLRTNVDEAFTRRLDALIDFPEPDEELRLALWDRCLGAHVPRDADVDLTFLAERFRLSGGNIRNVAVSAAFLAAAGQRAVSMEDLVVATAREYRKLGRLCTASEFGVWLEKVTS